VVSLAVCEIRSPIVSDVIKDFVLEDKDKAKDMGSEDEDEDKDLKPRTRPRT